MKRNSIDDATHYYGDSKYYLTDSEFYQYSENKWVNIDEHVDGMTFKKINKEVKMKEYLVKNMYGDYVLTDHHSGFSVEDLIEVPEGAEILYFDKRYEPSNHFFKTVGGNSYYKYLDSGSKWMKYDDVGLNKFKDNIENFRVVWQRNATTLDGNNTSTKDKLKFIEKWLNGEKIQYILGEETDKSQWHNLTEGAMQYIKRSDIKFREAPKYVTINGIEFKSVESLFKYVNNNFYLEDGDYFRFKTIQFGYSLPSSILEKASIAKARVYLTGENLFTFTKYSGYDPEIGGGVMGIDRGFYPQAKTFMLGVNLQF